MYIYINGIMSGVSSYDRTNAKLPISADTIKINSDYCDIDLYTIRIYNTPLTSANIVQNYLARKKDLNLYY
jgi:hypothetical protein